MIRLLNGLYDRASLVVRSENRTSDPIEVTKGVLQGDSLSPFLFSCYLRNIESFFRGRGFHGIPLKNQTDILMLLFADDIVIFADGEVDLRNKINCLSDYCESLKLTVNIEKTKIVPFHARGHKHASGCFRKFCEGFIRKARITGESVIQVLQRAKSDTWDAKMKLYVAVVLPSILYGSEVWGLGCADVLERAQLYFLKRVLLLNVTSPSWAVHL
ncbi:uncharacterized protein LOC120350321 [Nilaparvata lugens]|uniref:uncharacterized protein LOC120350321 n=1 Tax=Nilaparvata lugens TaxID=108931 RepID=UPI00193D04AB|nr:uncharacterized protein LOC120350321 [Nilaparvata lugens]